VKTCEYVKHDDTSISAILTELWHISTTRRKIRPFALPINWSEKVMGITDLATHALILAKYG
jgi:hypothetical protein